MENLSEGLINGILKVKQAHDWIKQMQAEIEAQKRRDGLRKGSIDVEFRVIK
jgi:hypothetical protein